VRDLGLLICLSFLICFLSLQIHSESSLWCSRLKYEVLHCLYHHHRSYSRESRSGFGVCLEHLGREREHMEQELGVSGTRAGAERIKVDYNLTRG
jgi:hypothetical protein